MKWTVHGRRELYRSAWVGLSVVEVERPDGQRYEHHVIDGPDAAGVVVEHPERGVLAIWRHRFLADEWTWEIPAGMVDPGETPEEAARRECIEESGWEPGPLQLRRRFLPNAGQSTQTFWVFGTDEAVRVGDPVGDETERVEWLSRTQVSEVLSSGQVLDALSVIALTDYLARNPA